MITTTIRKGTIIYGKKAAGNSRQENVKNGIFDASDWEPKSSGLLGPVTLTPAMVKQ